MSLPRARLEDWPTLLHAFVASRAGQPFAWGSHDCCLFAADCIAAITGRDLAAPLRGYTSALGAVRTARRIGTATAEDPYGVAGWPDLAQLPEIPVAFARRGDVVLVQATEDPRTRALAVCLGAAAAVPGPTDLAHLPRSTWQRAWSVG